MWISNTISEKEKNCGIFRQLKKQQEVNKSPFECFKL